MVDESTPLVSKEESHPTPSHSHTVSWDVDAMGKGGLDDAAAEEFAGPRHHRSDSTGSVLEAAFESIHDVGEAIAETVEEVVEEFQEVMAEEIMPIKGREEGEHDKKLGAFALAVLVFYKVSGGPFGMEPSVKAGGAFAAILGFIIFPFIWSIQEALVTAELGSAFPEPSGSVAWVEEAFGPKAGLLSGYFHWISGATDNAIYPSLFLKYIAAYIHKEDFLAENTTRFLFTIAITFVLSCINYTGLEIVGNLSILVSIISMSPFVILCLIAIPRIEPSRWFATPEAGITLDDDVDDSFIGLPNVGGVMWTALLNNLFWNLNSFDVGASFAGEVKDPERVFPRAMFMSVILVTISYILPLMAAVGALDTDQSEWEAGFLTTVTVEVGGKWLGAWMVLAAAISNIALFEAEMSGDAYQLLGMADRGMIPKLFCKRSRFDTPQNGIILGTIVIFFLSAADFDQLVAMLNFAYAVPLLMEFAAFIKLRISEPDIERPYRIPFGTVGCCIFLSPAVLFLIYLLLTASKLTYGYFAILTVFGFLFHAFQKIAHHYHFIEYAEAPKRKKKTSVTPTENSPKKDEAA